MREREILDSWKEISRYLRRDIRTCQRYERELELPVHRLEGSPRARVFAYRNELDAWRAKRLEEDQGPPSTFWRTVTSRPFLVVCNIILVAGLAIFYFARIRNRLAGPGHGESLSIAVLPFQNASGRADLGKWTDWIPNLLIQGLSGSKYFDVPGYDLIYGTLQDLNLHSATGYSSADLGHVAKRTVATHFVTGLIIKAGERLVIALATERIGGDQVFASRFECEDEAAIILAVDRMVDQIKRDLGLTRTTQAGDFDATGVPVTTSSLEAFRLYNEGRRLHVAGEYDRSAQVMRTALARDPEFALAWRSLAASLDSQGADAEAEKCLQKALEFSCNASMQERFYIRTTYFHHRSEFGRALQTSREWASLYPDDTQAMLFTGRACLFEEDADGARSALDEGLRKGDRNPFMFFYAVLACAAAGSFKDADEIVERGLSIHPGNRLIAGAAVINAVCQGQYDRALGELREMRGEKPSLSIDLRSGDILLLKGDFRGAENRYTNIRPLSPAALTRLARLALAEGLYGRAADLAEEAGNHAFLAYIESRRGRLAKGLEAAEKALKAGEERGHYLTELAALQMKGTIEALAGNLETAKDTAARLRESGQRSGLEKAHERAVRCLNGLIASAEGRHEHAAEEFEAAVALMPRDIPYLDDQPLLIGIVASMHDVILFYAAQQYEKKGDTAAALDHYLKLLGLHGGRLQHPDLFALSHHALGRIRQSRGDLAGARESYNKFLELWKNADPGIPEVEEAKARLAALDRSEKR